VAGYKLSPPSASDHVSAGRAVYTAYRSQCAGARYCACVHEDPKFRLGHQGTGTPRDGSCFEVAGLHWEFVAVSGGGTWVR
jgi:hypothetical protein